MDKTRRYVGLWMCVALAWTAMSSAAVKLPAIIGDHMALQRNQAVPIWGWAAPGEKITASIASQQKSTTAGADGKWTIRLDPAAGRRAAGNDSAGEQHDHGARHPGG